MNLVWMIIIAFVVIFMLLQAARGISKFLEELEDHIDNK